MKLKEARYQIGILGFGTMGQAIFRLLKNNVFFQRAEFFINSLGLKTLAGAKLVKTINGLTEMVDIIFLCIKPQNFQEFVREKRRFIGRPDQIVISIMAGVPVKKIKQVFPRARVVRAMPNLPLLVGQGMTGWYIGEQELNKTEERLVQKIFSVFGQEIKVQNEKQLNAVTAISGSGPAYVALFWEALIKSAINLGFDRQRAEKLAYSTIAGTVAYLTKQKNITPSVFISKVASKGGTTEAALQSIGIKNFEKLWQKAVRRAYFRAQELSK